ncbi:LytR/AlgR family response regulator transcription factor [Ekhidna sp.]|uniref:LytR/AlgR family response regulator transcription factor n=1 Tax=Ekhidna sp. TaxID=2608089 RepID=UPI003C7A405B
MNRVNPFYRLSKKEQQIHFIVWVIGLILINIPSWNVTLGPFYSNDYSLIIPSIYGALLNAHLFYESAGKIEGADFNNILHQLKYTFLIFLIVTVIESLLDTLYFSIHYWTMSLDIVYEILVGQILMNFIFFYLPSIMFGFIKAWQKSESTISPIQKLIVKDGHKNIHLNLDELSHLESDGNYCIYHADKKHVIRQTLAQAEKELPDFFVRCHKSFIINTHLIDKQSYDEIVVKAYSIPIGRKYRKNVTAISNN